MKAKSTVQWNEKAQEQQQKSWFKFTEDVSKLCYMDGKTSKEVVVPLQNICISKTVQQKTPTANEQVDLINKRTVSF